MTRNNTSNATLFWATLAVLSMAFLALSLLGDPKQAPEAHIWLDDVSGETWLTLVDGREYLLDEVVLAVEESMERNDVDRR